MQTAKHIRTDIHQDTHTHNNTTNKQIYLPKGKHIVKQRTKQTDLHTTRQTHKQTYNNKTNKTDIQTYRQIDIRTDKQTYIQTD